MARVKRMSGKQGYSYPPPGGPPGGPGGSSRGGNTRNLRSGGGKGRGRGGGRGGGGGSRLLKGGKENAAIGHGQQAAA